MKTALVLLVSILVSFVLGQQSTTVENANLPEQLRLALTSKPSEMLVSWNTKDTSSDPVVRYTKGGCRGDGVANGGQVSAESDCRHYDTFTGCIHHAVLQNLAPGTKYCYVVGDGELDVYSEEAEFNTAPTAQQSVSFVAIADAGTWGDVTEVMKQLAADKEPTLVLHMGDLSYAQKDEVWDTFGIISEQVAMQRPYMVLPGNWDVKDFAVAGFYHRYTMPLAIQPSDNDVAAALPPKPLNFFYSFDYSSMHVVMLSSYDEYHNESVQYKWLEKDLMRAQQHRASRPWIVLGFHSPMYSSSTGHGGSDTKFRNSIEPLLLKYKVDLCFTGHDHGYERTYPVAKEVPSSYVKQHYVLPQAPIHVLAGTAGATTDPWLELPRWSAHREGSTGYTKVTIYTNGTLHAQYLRINGTTGDEFWITKVPSSTGAVSPGFLLLLLVVVIVFPLCAYKDAPRKIFGGLAVPRTSAYNYRKSIV